MFASKLPEVGTTIFTQMSQLALEHGAVNLGQGFPDFLPDAELMQRVAEAMAQGHNQYAPMAGVPALRQAIAAKMTALYARSYDPDTEVTVTSGATQALMAAILACAGAGDEVVILEPAYDAYVPAIQLAGATPVRVPMLEPDATFAGYRPDWSRVQAAVTDRTRAIIVNFPHNPTGAILAESDLDALEDIVRDRPIVLISDEVYEHIVFDGKRHLSLASRPALADRTFVISSAGKTLHTTGWKIGWCCAPAALSSELRKVHQFMVFSVSTPMQHAIAAHMADPHAHDGLAAFYQERRDYLVRGLAQTALTPLPCPGTFFLLANYQRLSAAPQDEFVRWLTVQHGVTAIPVSAFYGASSGAELEQPRIVRLCFAKQRETLDEAVRRLEAIRI
ncbi:aminotransferase class I/II-fold pyridoxal phosphate-dependent enzyme [Achromobacter sp. GG226]|uniref:methionine aminotransferase n=1 Tax=Verticiella alkaliphila TaxID=2779529 RepID=UPI001C0CDD4D|nr:methionine aminotransferase [Verticiella sp. GG226]MBU4611179.1 aminotransferase class I/II-fold pyridoxal phosphate-dependent enzyme [Verticiella sp. GG226]